MNIPNVISYASISKISEKMESNHPKYAYSNNEARKNSLDDSKSDENNYNDTLHDRETYYKISDGSEDQSIIKSSTKEKSPSKADMYLSIPGARVQSFQKPDSYGSSERNLVLDQNQLSKIS